MCPLIIDLGDDGFSFGGRLSAVRFDMFGNGQPDLLQWVLPNGNDAFLIMDLNDNGKVDNGSELFGNGTEMVRDRSLARNGFVALGQYDNLVLGGNDDGAITDADGIWEFLFLWFDLNANGRSDPGELRPPTAYQITSFEVIHKNRGAYFDEHGNWLRFWSKAKRLGPLRKTAFDVIDVFLLKVRTPTREMKDGR